MKALFRNLWMACAVLAISSSFAQKNYEPAKIFIKKGDTLNAMMQYTNWNKNPQSVKVKHNNSIHEFFPSDINGFEVDGRLFLSARIEIDVKSRDLQKLNDSKDPVLIEKDVFLWALFYGDKCLYSYRGQGGNHNFYIGPPEKPILLVYTKYMKQTQEMKKIVNYQAENQMYKGQLIHYFKDCMQIVDVINGAEYFPRSLIKVFTKYYDQCSEEEPYKEIEKSRFKLKTSVGAYAGFSNTSLEFSGMEERERRYLPGTDFPSSSDFTMAALIDLIFPLGSQNFSLVNEIQFTQFSTSGTYLDYRSATQEYHFSSELSYKYLGVNTMLRYKIPVKDFQVYAKLGISNNFVLSEKNLT